MKKYPDFRIDVYPTRRSGAAPQYVYDNTFKNATRAKLVDNGQGVEGAFGGIPFPIPKDALRGHPEPPPGLDAGVNTQTPLRVWVMTADGKRTHGLGRHADLPPRLPRPGRHAGEVRRLLRAGQVRRHRAGLEGRRGHPRARRPERQRAARPVAVPGRPAPRAQGALGGLRHARRGDLAASASSTRPSTCSARSTSTSSSWSARRSSTSPTTTTAPRWPRWPTW